MSWLVVMFKVPDGVKSMAELPPDYKPPMFPRDTVISTIKGLFPKREFINTDGIMLYSYGWEDGEISIENAEFIDHISLRSPSMEIVKSLSEKLGWLALHSSDGEFITFAKTN